MKPVKNAIAFVIYDKNHAKVLVVQRPSDDKDLPNIWGLPAGSLSENESYEDAVLRSGNQKLGVDLKIVKLINEGEIERKSYTLHMKLYEVEIVKGKPKVPQPAKGITQYQNWEWATPNKLKEAAKKGSLCSRLFLAGIGVDWQ